MRGHGGGRARGWPAWAAAFALASALAATDAPAQERRGAGHVPVAARDLPRGAVLGDGDVEGQGAGSVEGWVTRRVIAAGEPLRAPAVAPPDLVRSGEVVQLVWRDGEIEIRLVGRAMGSAGRGERVQVRVDSRRRFAGVVEERGVVRIRAGESER